jgi:D-glycero-beta-D-manno-heptose 1-phosphate adenylyltransferase
VRAADKVLPREEVAKRLKAIRRKPAQVIFTCGVFDLLHVGHVRYLEFARNLGTTLIVGINSDESVRSLGKGEERPLVPERERAEIVAALACVDYVFIFDETRPNESIRVIRPDVHVKDAAYQGQELPEAGALGEVGGKLIFAPHVEGHSTSLLLEHVTARKPLST